MSLDQIVITPAQSTFILRSKNPEGLPQNRRMRFEELDPEQQSQITSLVEMLESLQPKAPSPALLSEIDSLKKRLAELEAQALRT